MEMHRFCLLYSISEFCSLGQPIKFLMMRPLVQNIVKLAICDNIVNFSLKTDKNMKHNRNRPYLDRVFAEM